MKKCLVCKSEFKEWRKTQKFCSKECYHHNGNKKLRKKSTWWIDKKGYIEGRVWVTSERQIRVKRHRWVMENHLGRKLNKNEDVHHLNGNKQDNSLGNLVVMDHGEHSVITNSNRQYKSGYKMNLSEKERQRRATVLKRWHKQQSQTKAGADL